MAKRAALILAGGSARRFQAKGESWQDKALALLQGKPLLIHAVENAESVVDEIVICVNNKERKAAYAELLEHHGFGKIKFAVDQANFDVSGPNLAILSGLNATEADYCLSLPCDMPFLKPEVARYLFSEAADCQVTVPMWPNGRLETLLMAMERKSSLQIAHALCALKRPRSDDIPRGASQIKLVSPVAEIRKLDPQLKSFININCKEDLTKLQTRHAHGSFKENVSLKTGNFQLSALRALLDGAEKTRKKEPAQASKIFESAVGGFERDEAFFWAGVAGENCGETLLKLAEKQAGSEASRLDFDGKEAYLKAANDYRLEAEMYEKNNCRLLEERALADKLWCESWGMGKSWHMHRYPSKVN
jgi:molybdenum cofactor guanylyltransferase